MIEKNFATSAPCKDIKQITVEEETYKKEPTFFGKTGKFMGAKRILWLTIPRINI